jgi:hypothetical protein
LQIGGIRVARAYHHPDIDLAAEFEPAARMDLFPLTPLERRIADIRLVLWVGGRRVGAEQCAGCCDVLGAIGAGEEPVVADAVTAPAIAQKTSFSMR